jgi:4-amino-4-deoxy-L-arabinose transferase-like glycosyltransferase
VYNPLNKFVRRIVGNMGIQLLSTSSLAVLILGFNLVEKNNDTTNLLFWIGVALFVVACLGWYLAIDKSKQKDKDAEKERKHLNELLEAIATKMGVDVDKLTKGK